MEVTVQQTIQDKISEKIRSSFIELIPQEAFDKMVATAVDAFMNGTPEKQRARIRHYNHELNREEFIAYNPINDPDTLPGMVMAELRKLGKEHIAHIMTTDGFMHTFDGCEQVAGEVLHKAIGDNSAMFVQALFTGIVSRAMMEVQNQIRNGRLL